MARDHGRVNLALFGDDDFLDLSGDANHLFLILWLSPSLTYCGSDDWHPGRIAKRCGSTWDARRVTQAAVELSSTGFLIVDTETDETLLRSWIKHDGLWKSPVMAVSMANARAAVASRVIRGVIVHEVLKLHEANREVKSWSRSAVASMLKQRPIDPSTVPPFNPSTNPCGDPYANPSLDPSVGVNGYPSPNPPPTPAPAPAPATQKIKDSSSNADALTDDDDLFEQFWEVYGKKVEKKLTASRWTKALKKKGVTADLLIQAAATYTNHQRDIGKHPQFTKNPAVWLNQECWNDELVDSSAPTSHLALVKPERHPSEDVRYLQDRLRGKYANRDAGMIVDDIESMEAELQELLDQWEAHHG